MLAGLIGEKASTIYLELSRCCQSKCRARTLSLPVRAANVTIWSNWQGDLISKTFILAATLAMKRKDG